MFAHIEIDSSICKGCGLCTMACPRKLLQLRYKQIGEEYPYAEIVDEAKCVGCALCAGMCPDLAIKVFSSQKNEFTGTLGRSFGPYSRMVSALCS
jgi:2-oxoglutarate ferredoxin oxidoreductase subunit delta